MDRTEIARQFLQDSRGTWPEIVEATGLGYQWCSKFAQGRIKNPSARLVDLVLEYKHSLPKPRKGRAA